MARMPLLVTATRVGGMAAPAHRWSPVVSPDALRGTGVGRDGGMRPRRVEGPARLRRVRRPGERSPDDRSGGRASERRGSLPPRGRQHRRHALLGGERRRRGGARCRLRGGALRHTGARWPVPPRGRPLAVA
jgi:hypothetical protein